MAYTTRWPVDATTNELVFVPVEFAFNGAANPTPLYKPGVTGNQVKSITRTGVGLYTINLDQGWPFFLGDSLKVAQASGSTNEYIVMANSDSPVDGTSGAPVVNVKVFQIGVGLADPGLTGDALVGLLFFRNRLAGM
jgi:hypothetical protein